MIKLCSLWKNENKQGEAYYRGSLSPNLDVLVLKNAYKTEANQPDYIAYIKVRAKERTEEEKEPLGSYTGLWKHEKGLQGRTKEGTMVHVKMVNKTKENAPDCVLYVAEPKVGGFE